MKRGPDQGFREKRGGRLERGRFRALVLALVLAATAASPLASTSSVVAESLSSTAGGRPIEVPPQVVREGPTSPDARSTPTRPLASPAESTSGAPGATFSVAWDSGFDSNPNAKTAFLAAVDIWAHQIVSAVPIRVQASFTDLGYSAGDSVLGIGGPSLFIPSFPNQPNPSVYYPLALANAIAGSEQYPTNYCSCELTVSLNSNANLMPSWYLGTDGQPAANQNDMVSIALHELGHGLGFVGNMTVDSSGQGSYNPAVIFDAFAKTTPGNRFLLDASAFHNPSSALGAALTTDQGLVFDGPQTDAAGGPAHLFTPSSWSQGSSYNHLDQRGVLGAPTSGNNYYPDTSNNGLMRPVMPQGLAIHDPGPLMLGMFQDMGWHLNTPAVTATPTSVNPGFNVAAAWARVASPTPQDWIGVFANSGVPDTGSRVAWAFTNGAGSGSIPINLPPATPSGSSYELRLFSNNSFTKLATSPPFAVASPTLAGVPNPVAAGGNLTASWSGTSSPTSQDWIGVFANSSVPDTGSRVAWKFTGGGTSGSLNLSIPASTPSGNTYELRLFSNNSFTKLATSAPFAVATALSETPSPINSGSALTTTWSGISSPTSQDWIGVFANSSVPDTGARVAWNFTGGGPSGSLSLGIPQGTPSGSTYELRLFSNNSFTKLATSAPFTITQATVAESPSPVNPGFLLTASWTGIASPSANDWIAVFADSSTADTGARVAWRFLNGAASGSLPITIPAGTPSGSTYELRLFSNNSFTKLATSAPFSVASASVSESPNPVNVGGYITTSWSGIANPTAGDWIAVFATSSTADTGTRVTWAFTNGAASGSMLLPIPAGSTPGSSYELRLFSNNSFTKLATSSPFTVMQASVSETPSPVSRGSTITASWSGIANPTAGDWIAVFASSSTADTGTRVTWRYTTGGTSGSVPLTIPASATPGTTYELRLFSNNNFIKLATSASFVVT